jgi:Flp pilus assembly protein TadB
MFDFDDFDKDKIKKTLLISILSVSTFILLLLIFPTMAYIIVILGILIPAYILYKKKKEDEEN